MAWSQGLSEVLFLLQAAGEVEERVPSFPRWYLWRCLSVGVTLRCSCPRVLLGAVTLTRQPSAGWHLAQGAVLGWASWVRARRSFHPGPARTEALHLLLLEALTVLARRPGPRQACGPVAQRDGPPRRVWMPRVLVTVLEALVSEGVLVCSLCSLCVSRPFVEAQEALRGTRFQAPPLLDVLRWWDWE